MSDADDDAKKLAEISSDLTPLDLDSGTSEQIARRARLNVGRPRPHRRWLLPAIVVVLSLSWLTWAMLQVFEVYG